MVQFSRRIFLLVISGLLINGYKTIKTDEAECSLGDNMECNVPKNKTHSLTPNDSIIWNIGITDTVFSYTLETAENGEDLLVGGIVACKLLIGHWLKQENRPDLTGIRVTLFDNDTNETIQYYDTEFGGNFTFNDTAPEFRLDFDNVLMFNKTYRTMVHLLPLGKSSSLVKWNNKQFLFIEPRIKSRHCESMTMLAQRWSPQLSINVYEATSKLSISWRVAPTALCIFSYKLTAYNTNRTFFHQNVINRSEKSPFVTDDLFNVPKDQKLTIIVNAQVMTIGQCVCSRCNCHTKKKRRIMIPSSNKIVSPIISKLLVPAEKESSSSSKSDDDTIFLIILIMSIILLISILIGLCVLSTRKKYSEHIFLRNINHMIFPNNNSKTYRILIVCPNIDGQENEYMTRICEGFKKSEHRAICDKFAEFSHIAEQNMLQWIYRESDASQKIIIFHSTTPNGSLGIHDVITSFLPANDSRVVNVLLSEKVKCNYPCETRYVLPRDERIFEQAFNLEISQPQIKIHIPNKEVEMVSNCETGDDDHNTHTLDSGVSSMSSSGSDTQENFSETLHTDAENELNVKNDNRPLLQNQIAT